MFLGDSTETSSNGMCSCKRSSNCNKIVSESNWCSKYQKWGVLAAYIAKKENEEQLKKQKEENARIEREMRYEQERAESELRRERQRIESERLALEAERKKLEYEKWYGSLSPDEKLKEDRRVEEEKRRVAREAEERRIREEEKLKEREAKRLAYEENARKKKKRKRITILCIIGAIILLVSGICIGKAINNSISEKKEIEAFNNSSTGVFTKYLANQQGYSDGVLTQYIDIEGRGRIYIQIEYKKNGFVDNYDRTCDFRVATILLPKPDDSYTEIHGLLFFNLDGSDNDTSFGTIYSKYGTTREGYPNFCADAKYGIGSVMTQYQQVKYNEEKGEPEYNFCYFNYNNWDNSYNGYTDEWKEEGWLACVTSYIYANDLYKEATGTSLYK